MLIKQTKKRVAGWLSLLLVGLSVSTQALELGGNIELEATAYADEGAFNGQNYRSNGSIALEPEWYWETASGNNSITFRPFGRIDGQDEERTHADVRELFWLHVRGPWEFRVGARKVFWGVTEFVHLVDVINQTDAVDSFDGEEKLGQLMFNVSRVTDQGIFDFFVLPGFRERTFAGTEGRLRTGLVVDTDRPRYESSKEEDHIDYALRWSHSLGVFDVGAYWFGGTDREPIFEQALVNGRPVLIPFYQQVSQVGIDVQATIDSWLLKWESLVKDSDLDTYSAVQTGVEYTFYGLNQSPLDLGVLLEYGWDERGEDGGFSQNDIYLGARLTFNDAYDTAVLAGVSYDRDFESNTFLLEASRRLNDNWTAAIEALIFDAGDSRDPLAQVEQDDRVQLTLERFF